MVLAGCGSFGGFPQLRQPESAAASSRAHAPGGAEIPATIRSSEVVGRWGYAAFHRPEDRARTEAAARGQCDHPYVIGQGPSGGVMMYLADQSQLQEFWLKGGPGGKNYIGPHGEAGGPRIARSCRSTGG